ncbi:MAG: Tim44/TimA family putative adaptor protein [Caulobacterales bacterium]
MQILELLLLAALAVLVLARLYMVLGKGGPGPEQTQAPVQRGEAADGFARKPIVEPPVRSRAFFTGPAADGLEAIAGRDPEFDPEEFVDGAKQAYSMIVGAFAAGDRQALRPLLTDDVYASYDQAIRERTGKSLTQIERIRGAHITAAEMRGDIATVTVRFEANLDTGDEHRFVDARENWTFERNVTDTDPNWRLASVSGAD